MIKTAVTWDELCERGRKLSAKDDQYRWRLGDLARHIDRTYRDKGIEEFAREIGRPKSSVYQYSKVAAMFPKTIRRRILEDCPNITYTYFRDALRLKDRKEAVKWLYGVSANGLTADAASRALTEKIGHKTRDSMEGEITERYHEGGETFLVLRLNDDYELERGRIVVLKAKQP